MKITFPHMGNLYIALKAVFEDLQVEVVTPPPCSKKTLALGTQYAPELMCVPFKLTVGNYIESIEKGADTLFMWGGCDVCRIGFYNTLQKDILKDLGYDIEMICVESLNTPQKIRKFFKQLCEVANTTHSFALIALFIKGIQLVFRLDELEELMIHARPREIHAGSVDILQASFEKEIRTTHGYKETYSLIDTYKKKIQKIEINPTKEVLQIGIVGEIYTVVEPFINFELVKKLGNMGVDVHRSVTTGKFVREQLDFLPFMHSNKKNVHRAAHPYIEMDIGGHCRHTVGDTVLFGEKGFDGVVHLLPFTCMPEIVAQSILPTVEKDKNIPILKLVLDEMTGEAGYVTRLEAFVDLLWKRREYAQDEKMLSRN